MALLLCAFSTNLLPATVAFADHNNSGDIKVREPGSSNEIPNNDPQLSSCSIVVDFYNFDNTTPKDATVAFAPQSPTSSANITVTGDLTPTVEGDGDADGQGNNDLDGSYTYTLSFVGTPGAQGYHVKLSVDVPGQNGGSKQKVFYMPASCQQKVTATAPTTNDVCGLANDTYTIPTTAHVKYYVNGSQTAKPAGTYSTNGASSVSVTAVAFDGYGLNGQSSWTLTFTNSSCIVVIEVPATPTVNDPCGLDNATWQLPADTAQIDWALTDGVLTATAKQGYVFAGGKTTINYGEAEDSGELCVIEIPVTPGVNDPCGLDNATWNEPEKTPSSYSWKIVDGELIAVAATDYAFEGGVKEINFGVAVDSGELCVVTPTDPEWADFCGEQNDYLYTPEQWGVNYEVTWNEDYTQAHVVATPASEDFAFTEGATTEWTYDFSNENCVTMTKTAGTLDDTDQSGGPSVGDVMHWDITVTNNGTEWWENFYVQIADDGTVLENDGLIESLAPGESVTLHATKALTAQDMSVCKITNTASYEAWYSRMIERSYVSEDDGEDMADFTGEATAEYTFTCPTTGHTLGTSTTKLPATIPATGGSDNTQPYLLIAASVMAYGLTYFIQGRRRVYETQ